MANHIKGNDKPFSGIKNMICVSRKTVLFMLLVSLMLGGCSSEDASGPVDPGLTGTASVSFVSDPQAGGVPSEQLNILARGGAEIEWTATKSSDWLVIDPDSGETPITGKLYVDHYDLASGLYYDTIIITPKDTSINSLVIPVSLDFKAILIPLAVGNTWYGSASEYEHGIFSQRFSAYKDTMISAGTWHFLRSRKSGGIYSERNILYNAHYGVMARHWQETNPGDTLLTFSYRRYKFPAIDGEVMTRIYCYGYECDTSEIFIHHITVDVPAGEFDCLCYKEEYSDMRGYHEICLAPNIGYIREYHIYEWGDIFKERTWTLDSAILMNEYLPVREDDDTD